MDDEIITGLRDAYNRSAGDRERGSLAPWKRDERQRFLELLRDEGKQVLLEIGAGTGKDGLFFEQHGLDVTCTDLSPAMVALCRQKGLRAHVRDFLNLGFAPDSFDAVYALNCLLHVPKRTLPAVLEAIHHLLRPGGLFYLGVYGGRDSEGIWADDDHEPKRFFSFHTDDGIQEVAQRTFGLVSFACIAVDRGPGLHVQSLILRR